jgi:tetratricopeptide (TPR) repeat protein
LSEQSDTYKKLQLLLKNSQFDQLESCAQAYLKQSDNTQISYILAVSYRLNKQYNKAIKLLKTLIKKASEYARAFQELGYNYTALGDKKNASVNFYQATKLNPALLTSWQALLPIYRQFNEQQAITLCEKQINTLSALPKPILAATDLMYDGNLLSADGLCRQYLQANKHSISGLILLAEIAVRLKAVSEAEFILETCAELAPENTEVKYQLFKIYSKLGKFPQALSMANSLVENDSDNLFYQVAQATAMVGVGELERAIHIYRNLIGNGRRESNVNLLLGHALKTANDIEQSISAYKAAYQIEQFCGDAYWSLANTKTYQFSSSEIASMSEGVESEQVNVKNKIHLYFALGKAYEDRQEYSKSMQHYVLGNQLQNQQSDYSSVKHQGFIQNQIDTFNLDFINDLKDLGHDDPSPIFIVGMPRAGSTLLEQILASHSQVDGTMELHEILGLAARLSKTQDPSQGYPSNLANIPRHYFTEFGQQFIKSTKVYRQSAPFFIDKMPNNFMHIGLIKSILPKAKIIDARRNEMACCFSGFKQLFGEGQEFSYSLSDIASYYKNYVKLMDHWQKCYPGQILLMHYEDMVNDTEQQVRRLLEYCQLPFEENCLSFYNNKRAVKTPSSEQVRQPIYASGLAQWQHFEPYLGELVQSLAAE